MDIPSPGRRCVDIPCCEMWISMGIFELVNTRGDAGNNQHYMHYFLLLAGALLRANYLCPSLSLLWANEPYYQPATRYQGLPKYMNESINPWWPKVRERDGSVANTREMAEYLALHVASQLLYTASASCVFP